MRTFNNSSQDIEKYTVFILATTATSMIEIEFWLEQINFLPLQKNLWVKFGSGKSPSV